ncbi:MAG: SDR family oxidoreductase, partial [Lachnospiraceae bacterium]|nr:SDR family oxidoreductase [Lachnospiraceae bacterium]
ALLCAEHGADLVLMARNTSLLEQAAQEIRAIGGKALPVSCDLTDYTMIPGVIERIVSEFGRIDVWVNNAGISLNVAPEDLTEEMWNTLMDVNLKSVFLWSQAAYRQMMKQKSGRLIHISSIGGQKGARNNGVHYVASKGGIIAMSKGLALTGAPYGITSNTICPGLVDTDMAVELGFDEAYISQVPLKRLATGRDIGGAVVYLSSALSDYVTGATLDVNGGLYLR